MAINPNYFAPVSGLGPQSGGFNPTPADALGSAVRQASSMGLMEYALYTDPRARALAGLVATGLAGDPNQAAMLIKNSAQGQFIKDTVGVAMSAGLVPGGNPMQLAASVQQMVGSQGFNIGGNLGRNSPMFGGGAITDMISKQVFDQVRNNFFDPVSGLAKRNTFGLNMSQMGDAMQMMSARGVFRGMDLGELNRTIETTADGKTKTVDEFKINKSKLEKVGQMMTDYSAMLRDARKIFGDLPISELTQNAERLVGSSLRDMGSISEMRNKLANIQAKSAAFGLNPAAVANRMMTETDSLQMGLVMQTMQRNPNMQAFQKAGLSTSFGRVSAAMAENAVFGGMQGAHAQAAGSNAYADQGVFMPVLGSEELTRSQAEGMKAILADASNFDSRENLRTGNMLPALYAADTGLISNPETAQKLRTLTKELASAPDSATQEKINRQIGDLLRSEGVDPNVLNRRVGTADMLRNLSAETTAVLGKQLLPAAHRSRLINEGSRELNARNMDFGLFAEGQDANKTAFGTLFNALDKKAEDAVFAAINPDGSINEDALNKAYETVPGLSDVLSKETFKQSIQTLASSSARKPGDFRKQMSQIMTNARRTQQFTSVGESSREALLSEERATMEYVKSISMGGPISKEDFGTEIMRGFFGQGKIDDNVIMQSLKNKGSTAIASFNMTADKTGLDIDSKGIDKLKNVLGAKQYESLAIALGVDPSDSAAMAKALSTPKGLRTLMENKGNALGAINEQGAFEMVSGTEAEAEGKLLEADAMRTAAEKLLGKDKAGKITSGDLSTEAGRAQYNTELQKELTRGKGAKLSEMADTFRKEGYGGEQFAALQLLYESNPAIRKGLIDSAKALEAKGGNENMDKARNLRALDRELQAASGEGGQYLGVLQIMSEGMTQLQLYKE